ncbi:MAG: trypsin-like peptidase domain-containing protein [Elusimicrobia bacterium]|nr:trypsin-like peptidase domain-containing protein [Elusimicrobiota bacterium]
MRHVLCLTAAMLFLGQAAWCQVDPKVIYGDDNRVDLYQVKDKKILKLADSTLALFEGAGISVDPATQVATLPTESYGQGMSLCKEEPFYDQVNGAFCSGSLVAPNVIMTAGHCVKSQDACTGTKFVFGFAVKKEGQMPTTVPASEVYSCSQLLGREQVGTGADWALVKLDRPVKGHTPLVLNKKSEPANKTPLFVIGHPAGLPTKVAGGATVRDASPKGYFVANLDTYGGNSGSAVFNAYTGLVEGILVRGENDYVWQGSCRVSQKCPADGCRGEDVTEVGAVLATLPPKGPAKTRVVPIGQALETTLEKLAAKTPDFDTARP